MADGVKRSQREGERRVRRRLELRWPLDIRKNQRRAVLVSTVTDNLSSRGFSCVVAEPLAAGESIDCLLKFPLWMDAGASRAVRCDAHVVWVKALEDGRFGIGCHIHDYKVII